MLIAGQSFNTLLKLIAFVFLLRAYTKHLRKSALVWSMAFLVDALSILFDVMNRDYGLAVSQAVAVSLLFYGTFMFLDEENIGFSPAYIRNTAGIAPLILTMYVLGYSSFRGWGPDELALVYGIAGFFYFFTGVLLVGLREIYSRKGMYLAAVFMLYGIHKMDYPFLRPVAWFAPIGFILGALFTLIEVVLLLNIISSEKFKKLSTTPFMVEFGSHVLVVGQKEFQEMKKRLSSSPVLAFLRDMRDVPGTWEAYFVSNVPGPRTVPPTGLEKAVELSHVYLMKAESIGSRGIIVIDCLEYLMMYNEFRSIAKFLSILRDYVLLHGGTIIVVLEEGAWSERQLTVLRRVLGAGD
ncbi:DUF835 domain-containing protein [Thermococcus sp.]